MPGEARAGEKRIPGFFCIGVRDVWQWVCLGVRRPLRCLYTLALPPELPEEGRR